jgi:amino acid transporter
MGIWFVLFCVIPPAVWWMLSSVMPRTGGDYVFASRALHPSLGFAASFGVTFALALTAIGASPLYGFALAAGQLEATGHILGMAAVTNAGTFIDPFGGGNKPAIYCLGFIVLIIGALFAITGKRLYNKVMWTIFFVGVVGLLVEVPILLTTSHATFVTDYANYYSGGVPGVLSSAAKAGYLPGWTYAASIAAVPLLLINYGPYLFMYNVAGEVKNSKKTYLYGAWGAIFLSAAIFFLLTFLLDRVVGLSFVEAWTAGPGGGYPPVVSALLAVVAPNLYLNIILAAVLLVGNIGFGYLGFAFASRPMFAWSFDRILPAKLSSVNEKFSSPIVAIIVTLAIALCGWTILVYTSFASVILDSLLIKFIGWGIVSLAAIVLPFTRKSIFERSEVNYKIGGLPIISILGTGSFLTFAYYVVNSITTKVFYHPTTAQGSFLIVLFGGAIIFYFIAAAYRKRQGIDISSAFLELPPE